MDAPPSLAWGIRLGLLLMVVSQAVGVQMIAEGGNTYGAAGALKVPHAVTLHAVQVLPALAILLLVARSNERRRLRIVALGAVGYAVLIASTLVQTYDGRGPLDLSPLTSTLALLGIATLAIAGLLRPPRHPQSKPRHPRNSVSGLVTTSRQRSRCPVAWRR